MRITRSCLIIRNLGTHTTPRVLHFSALLLENEKIFDLKSKEYSGTSEERTAGGQAICPL